VLLNKEAEVFYFQSSIYSYSYKDSQLLLKTPQDV